MLLNQTITCNITTLQLCSEFQIRHKSQYMTLPSKNCKFIHIKDCNVGLVWDFFLVWMKWDLASSVFKKLATSTLRVLFTYLTSL